MIKESISNDSDARAGPPCCLILASASVVVDWTTALMQFRLSRSGRSTAGYLRSRVQSPDQTINKDARSVAGRMRGSIGRQIRGWPLQGYIFVETHRHQPKQLLHMPPGSSRECYRLLDRQPGSPDNVGRMIWILISKG